jgi:hypothetical protein
VAKYMSQGAVIEMAHTYFPSFLRSRNEALLLGAWSDGKQYDYSEDLDQDHPGYGRAYSPDKKGATEEYENLRGLSPNNFAGLIVTTMSQMAILEGISKAGVTGILPVWDTFRRNRWASKASAVHRGALGQATAYGVVLPGEDPLTGSAMSKMLGKSATKMAAFYDNDDDEWPVIAIEAEPVVLKQVGDLTITGPGIKNGWAVKVYDSYVVHNLRVEGDGAEVKDWTYVDHQVHGMPVPPVARCANRLDLDGRATGEIEPVLPILRRIDQDLFDRLINQRFGAWQVRYIAGMAKPEKKSEQATQAMILRVSDLLVSTSDKTKFGTLPAGDIDNQIKATDADLRILSAIAQMAPHHLLGLSSNLQAEALAAATEGLQRRASSFRVNAGEFHEQMARLASMAQGDYQTAASMDLRVRWKDTESGSMSQAADALGKLSLQLGVPVEMLWERIPGWTDDDVQRAKELVESGSFEKLMRELLDTTPDGTETPKKATSSGRSD